MYAHRLIHPLNRTRCKFSAFRASQDGVALVEFALIVPVLLIMLLGLWDYGMAVFNKMELESAVRSGAQYALVQDSDAATISSIVLASSSLNPASVTVSVTPFCQCSDGTVHACGGTCPTGAERGYTTVTANYTHTWLFLMGTTVFSKSMTIRTK